MLDAESSEVFQDFLPAPEIIHNDHNMTEEAGHSGGDRDSDSVFVNLTLSCVFRSVTREPQHILRKDHD